MNWSIDEEATVKQLWLAGYTGKEISRATGMSRDRVLSKIRRMQLGRALRFADEVETLGSVERAALAVGYSIEQGRRAWGRIVKGLGWQAQ